MNANENDLLIENLGREQYLNVMREKVGPDTWDALHAVRENKRLPQGVRENATGLIEDYESFDGEQGALLGHLLRRWHSGAWYFLETVRAFEESKRIV